MTRLGVEFLNGGGELGRLTREYDWGNSTIGPPETWPSSLKAMVRLVLQSGHPMFIWWGPDLIQFYNDAYRQTMGPERHPGALGQKGGECWAEIWDTIGPMIDYVRAGKGSTWDEYRLVPVTRHGRREDVWWTFSYVPIDLEDDVGGVLVICNDVTTEHNTKEALKRRALQLERLFEQAPSFIAILRGPDHVFELVNAAYKRLLGDRDYIGKSVLEVVTEAKGQGFIDLLDRVYTTGVIHVGKQTPLTPAANGDGQQREVFLDFVYAPIVEEDGTVSGIFVDGHEATDYVMAHQHLQLLNEELKHRVKNTLAMVSSIAFQTLKGSDSRAEVLVFHDRLVAFARAHDALTSDMGASSTIEVVIRNALKPLLTANHHFEITGPVVAVGSKQAIALTLALHELATNSVKYGSISVNAGRVSIAWGFTGKGLARDFFLEWREQGGPAVVRPRHRGFGSRVIERVLPGEFGGSVELDFREDGLICRLSTTEENLKPGLLEPFLAPSVLRH